jgi:hypothetical protein
MLMLTGIRIKVGRGFLLVLECEQIHPTAQIGGSLKVMPVGRGPLAPSTRNLRSLHPRTQPGKQLG